MARWPAHEREQVQEEVDQSDLSTVLPPFASTLADAVAARCCVPRRCRRRATPPQVPARRWLSQPGVPKSALLPQAPDVSRRLVQYFKGASLSAVLWKFVQGVCVIRRLCLCSQHQGSLVHCSLGARGGVWPPLQKEAPLCCSHAQATSSRPRLLCLHPKGASSSTPELRAPPTFVSKGYRSP